MSSNTKIEWAHHTANPWWGCTKVSPACDNCYAEPHAWRVGKAIFGGLEVGWGPDAERRFRIEKTEAEARKWNRSAARKRQHHRVFCGSMMDVFEGRSEQRPYLDRLFTLVEETPNLDWLMLTKRANNISRLAPWGDEWPDNVWTGCTIENQEWADRRLPHLLAVPSRIRFVSVEPMFSAMKIRQHLGHGPGKINWVICGGESGARARGVQDMLGWYRDLRDQCVDAGVPFFFKQWGRFGQNADGALIKLRGKNKENYLDGVKWEQFPTYRHLTNRAADRAGAVNRLDRLLDETDDDLLPEVGGPSTDAA